MSFFLGGNLFKEKIFPEPLSETFLYKFFVFK